MAELDSELSGDFGNMLLDLMRLPWERELQALISSVSGVGTNELLLVHVLLTHDALVSCPYVTCFFLFFYVFFFFFAHATNEHSIVFGRTNAR